jgi:antitoxin YefM
MLTYHKWYDRRKYKMTTLSASEARKRLYNLVDQVKESHEPVQIVGKRNSAVLVSEEDWKAIAETLYLASIPGMRESIRKGLKTPVEKCSEKPGW